MQRPPLSSPSHAHQTAQRLILCIAFAAALLSVTACGPGPKPAQLVTTEKLRNAPEFSNVQQGAPGPIQRHDEFYKRAISAWQEGENDTASGYAEIANMYYEAADLRLKLKKENDRLVAANTEIDDLTRKTDEAKTQTDAAEAQLAQLLKDQENKMLSATKGGQTEQMILVCEAAKAKADGVGAATNAPGTYARADNSLKIAREQLQQKRFDDAARLASEATATFTAAYEEAKPFFDLEDLYKDAQRDFKQDAVREPKGVLVSIPRLFAPKKSSIDSDKTFMLDMIVKLAQKYPKTTLVIEGHVYGKGSSKDMSLSDDRAAMVLSYIVGQGIPSSRTVSVGAGSDRPRYDTDDKDERGKNDRVEITFTVTK